MIKELVKDEAIPRRYAPCHDRRRAGGGRPCGNADVDGRRRLLGGEPDRRNDLHHRVHLDDDDQPHVMYNPRLLQALGAFKAVEGCLSLEADSKSRASTRIKGGLQRTGRRRAQAAQEGISTAGRRRSSSTASTTARASWSSLMGKKPNAAARPFAARAQSSAAPCAAAWSEQGIGPQRRYQPTGLEAGITVRVMHAV